jgi:phage baseplate assembly protein W
MSDKKVQGDEVLGRGIAFPLRLAGGQIGMNAYESQVEQSIRLILRTARGERVMRPDFGAGIDTLAFEPMSAVTVGLLQHQVTDALQRFEPRIDVLSIAVQVLPANGELLANIEYRIKRTDSVHNLVYPFYVERGEA